MATAQTMWRAPRRESRWLHVLIAVAVLASARVAGAATSYDGHLILDGGRSGGASASLEASGPRLSGMLSLTIAGDATSGDYSVSGRQRGRRMTLKGATAAGSRVKWTGVSKDAVITQGVLRIRGAAGRLKAVLVLAPRRAGSTMCEDVFSTEVMARALVPVCSTCHVAGGAAQQTRLRVVADDPAATRTSLAALIDVVDPPGSVLLQKPTGGLGHGGGAQLQPGSPGMQALEHWVDLVATGQCDATQQPVDPGDPKAALYLAQCSSCHGTDARGVGGRPAVRCNRDVSDAVKSGRPGPTPETTMPAFLRLTDADIANIQSYLDGLCPAATATGADLYAGNCATCHGADAHGGTAPDIHCARAARYVVYYGVVGVFGGMPALLSVTDAESARIQTYLDGLCPSGSATGATLYANNCAGCHGQNGQGDAPRGRPDIRCSVRSRVNSAITRGRGFTFPVMPSLPFTDPEVTSMFGFFSPNCTQTPADLFASNCSTCHGPNGGGGQNADQVQGPNIRCSSSADVYDAVVDGTGGMPALPDLTNTQIDKIVTFVRTGCP
ncbi:MAG TPA: c-type cytochrome [Candidatus Eisenbacteria bacterium]|nr:c-type cytochrome [Candidatus Eisenbacteria bacterium]